MIKDKLTEEQVLALPPAVDLVTAGRAFGLGRTKSYELARAGEFPCPVLPLGHRFMVTKANLLRVLDIKPAAPRLPCPRPPPDSTAAPGCHSSAASHCQPGSFFHQLAGSRAAQVPACLPGRLVDSHAASRAGDHQLACALALYRAASVADGLG